MIQNDARVCKHCRRDLSKYRPFAPLKDRGEDQKSAAFSETDLQLPPIQESEPETTWPPMKFTEAIIIVIVILGVILVSIVNDGSKEPYPSRYAVTYLVNGSASSASLTYVNQSGGVNQINVRLPWTQQMLVVPGTFVSISAQKREAFGTINVVIIANGTTVVQQAASNAEYGIASASGVVP